MSKESDRFVPVATDMGKMQKQMLKEEARARNSLRDHGFVTRQHQVFGCVLRITLEHPMLHGICAVCYCNDYLNGVFWSPAIPTANGSWVIRNEYGSAFKSAIAAVRCRIKRVRSESYPISPLVRAYMLTKLKGVR